MTEFDDTVFTGKGAQDLNEAPPQSPPQPQESKRNPLLIIGGVGCALLLCVALLIGGGSYFYLTGDDNPLVDLSEGEDASPPVAATPIPEPAATDTPVPEPTADTGAAETPSDDTGDEPAASVEPEIGPLTFAVDATEEYEPIGASDTFEEGITKIHAIFDYTGILEGYSWERVWYLDGEEILRNPAVWAKDESGRFDYFLDAGGEALPSGDWVLEIYVEGELLADGDFTIEGEAGPDAAAAVGETPEPAPKPSPTPKPTSTVTPTTAPKPASGGGTYQLVYTKWDGGQHNMFVADTNGSNEQFLLNRAAGPSWTPNGQEIFFYGEEGVDRQKLPDGRDFIFDGVSNGIAALVNASARPNIEDALLAQDVGWKIGSARWASVSPDGQMVAFDAKPGGDYRIYFLGTADNQQFRFELIGEQGDWSPDSQKMVYRSGRDGKTGIWISNRDDSGHTLITNTGSDSFPAWSPNGRTIAFSREEGGNVDIYTVSLDGSNLQRITDAPGPDTLPIYTPSGDIIFRSARTGSWGIWKMSGSGAGQKEIIPNAGVGPDWAYSKMDVR